MENVISIQNHWWNEGGLWQDPDLVKVKNSFLKYHPTPFSFDDCNNPAVLTLRGPRRSGKTVSLKLLVADLIEKFGHKPKSILWDSFDTLRNLDQMEKRIIQLVDIYKPKIFIIDEITSVNNWQKVIKKLCDNGILSQCCLILTGSSASDLKSGAERMAGRRGTIQNPDRVLLPMNFELFNNQLKLNGLMDENRNLKHFFEVGGFPFRVENFLKSKLNHTEWKTENDFQVFDDIIFYEFNRRKLDRNIALEVLSRINQIGSSSTSYEGFAKSLSITKDTAKKYLNALGDSFLLSTIFSYDTGRSKVALKKDKKLIWIDPAFGDLATFLQVGSSSNNETRAEWIVGVELLRSFEIRIWEGLSSPRNIFTWKSSSGNEVDFLVINSLKKIKFPVEVKYQNEISDWDFQVIERAFGKGIIVSKLHEKRRAKGVSLSLKNFLLENKKKIIH